MGLAMATFAFTGCAKDNNDPIVYDYHAHIVQPSSVDKSIDDPLFIDVEFESHTGENVEHINVVIFRKDNSLVVYNKPDNAQVEGSVSSFNYTDTFVLSEDNGLRHGDYVLQARVWGAEDGSDEVVERVEFQINP